MKYDYNEVKRLRDLGFPFTQIADMLGYSNSKHLNSAFNLHFKRNSNYKPQRIYNKPKVLVEKLIPNYKTNTIETQKIWI